MAQSTHLATVTVSLKLTTQSCGQSCPIHPSAFCPIRPQPRFQVQREFGLALVTWQTAPTLGGNLTKFKICCPRYYPTSKGRQLPAAGPSKLRVERIIQLRWLLIPPTPHPLLPLLGQRCLGCGLARSLACRLAWLLLGLPSPLPLPFLGLDKPPSWLSPTPPSAGSWSKAATRAGS